MTSEEQRDGDQREAVRVHLQLQNAKEAKDLPLIAKHKARLRLLLARITPTEPPPTR